MPGNNKYLLKAPEVVVSRPFEREWTFLIWLKVYGDAAVPKQFCEQGGNHQEGIGLDQHFVLCVCDFVAICKIGSIILCTVFLPSYMQ